MANVYQKGDVVRCTGAFTDSSSVAYDPAVIRFKVKDPAEAVTSYTYLTDSQLVKSTTGNYYLDVAANQVGQWWYRMESDQGGDAANEDYFIVRRTEF